MNLTYYLHVQSNLVNPTPFVAHSFTPDSKVSGLSNQLYWTGNYHGYVVIITVKSPSDIILIY